MFFRLQWYWTGTGLLETSAYFSKYPRVVGVQSIKETSVMVSPGILTNGGAHELTDTVTWQGMFGQARVGGSHADQPGAIVTQYVQYGGSAVGPWTTLCTNVIPSTNSGAGWYDIVTCDIRPAFVPPAGPCGYGTRKKSGVAGEIMLTQFLISAASLTIGKTWWGLALSWLIGTYVNVDSLCEAGPEPLYQPSVPVLGPVGGEAVKFLYRGLWHHFCECTPGPLPVTPYDLPDWTRPPGIPDAPVYTPNPTNPCLDLTEVRRILDQILKYVGADYQTDTLMQRYAVPFGYVPGTVRTGLTGSGSFSVDRLIGVRVDLTANIPPRRLEGTPQYIWDVGWMSIMTGDGMIEEKRISQDPQIWQPRLMSEAVTFGYFFKGDVVATVTELQPESVTELR